MTNGKDFPVKQADLTDIEMHSTHQAEPDEPCEISNEIEVVEFVDLKPRAEKFVPQIRSFISPEVTETGIKVRINFLSGWYQQAEMAAGWFEDAM